MWPMASMAAFPCRKVSQSNSVAICLRFLLSLLFFFYLHLYVCMLPHTFCQIFVMDNLMCNKAASCYHHRCCWRFRLVAFIVVIMQRLQTFHLCWVTHFAVRSRSTNANRFIVGNTIEIFRLNILFCNCGSYVYNLMATELVA